MLFVGGFLCVLVYLVEVVVVLLVYVFCGGGGVIGIV